MSALCDKTRTYLFPSLSITGSSITSPVMGQHMDGEKASAMMVGGWLEKL